MNLAGRLMLLVSGTYGVVWAGQLLSRAATPPGEVWLCDTLQPSDSYVTQIDT